MNNFLQVWWLAGRSEWHNVSVWWMMRWTAFRTYSRFTSRRHLLWIRCAVSSHYRGTSKGNNVCQSMHNGVFKDSHSTEAYTSVTYRAFSHLGSRRYLARIWLRQRRRPWTLSYTKIHSFWLFNDSMNIKFHHISHQIFKKNGLPHLIFLDILDPCTCLSWSFLLTQLISVYYNFHTYDRKPPLGTGGIWMEVNERISL